MACSTSCASPGDPVWNPARVAEVEKLEAFLASTAQAPKTGDLEVRLAFGSGADLDLFVTDTDPRVSETVYFAKHTTRARGRLIHDARCSDESPRSDAVAYEAPLAAGYRIGVDYHRSCGDQAEFEVFVVEWMSGNQRQTRRGIARPGHFEDRFWMLNASSPASPNESPSP